VTSSLPPRGFRKAKRIALAILLPVALIGAAMHGYGQGWFTPNPRIDMAGPIAIIGVETQAERDIRR
jgi:hypothetical protein